MNPANNDNNCCNKEIPCEDQEANTRCPDKDIPKEVNLMYQNSCGYFDPSNPCKMTCIPRPITWRVTYLVSDGENAAMRVEQNLTGSTGIASNGTDFLVVNNATDSLLQFDYNGNRSGPIVNLRDITYSASFPTAIISNNTNGFIVNRNTTSLASNYIILTDTGHIFGFNSTVNPTEGIIISNTPEEDHLCNPKYKGGDLICGNLFVADWTQQTILEFDNNLNLIDRNSFQDDDMDDPIPNDYSPFNIVTIGNCVFVMYAKKSEYINSAVQPGRGFGFIDLFNKNQTFVRRFASRGELNAPWSIIRIPADCSCYPAGCYLVSNTGDGTILAYDYKGCYMGKLLNLGGVPLRIDGLHGLYLNPRNCNEIYFTAGPGSGTGGLFGKITREPY